MKGTPCSFATIPNAALSMSSATAPVSRPIARFSEARQTTLDSETTEPTRTVKPSRATTARIVEIAAASQEMGCAI